MDMGIGPVYSHLNEYYEKQRNLNTSTFFISSTSAHGELAMLICAAKWAFCWDFMAGRVMWVVTLRFNKGRLVTSGRQEDKQKTRI